MTRIEGKLLLCGELVPGAITLEGARIAGVERAVGPDDGAASRRVVAPGLIDLHVHGFGGRDPLEDLEGMGRALAASGTTGFQPTLFPRHPERLAADVRAVDGQARALADTPGVARPLGVHIEGPFLNPDAAGAIPVEDLVTPSPAHLRTILGPDTGDGAGVARMTIAPELPGCGALVEELVRCGVRASLGHSRASAAESLAGLERGASGITHLFNAMAPLHHREVGLAGTALTRDLAFVEIIGDLVHVGRDAFELALGARGPGGLCLVSDALKGAGTGCDAFHWHGREHVIRGGTAYYPPAEEGGDLKLAGSASSQLEMVRTLTRAGVVSLSDALTMGASTPARSLGLEGELGVLAVGARADLIVLEGEELALVEAWVGGERVALS